MNEFVKLQLKIEKECIRCFSDIREKYANEIICGYALISDSDATCVSAAINSKRLLSDVYSQAKKDDPEIDEACFKWSPSDWGEEIDTSEYFNDITELLYHESLDNNISIPFDEYRKKVHETIVSALETLVKNSFFEKDDDSCVIVFTLPGSEEPVDEIKWIKRLNSEKLSSEYEKLVNTYMSE